MILVLIEAPEQYKWWFKLQKDSTTTSCDGLPDNFGGNVSPQHVRSQSAFVESVASGGSADRVSCQRTKASAKRPLQVWARKASNWSRAEDLP